MLDNDNGFTLVELIAVLIIISIIGVMAARKFMKFDTTATDKMIDVAISELNSREKLIWVNTKLGDYDADIDTVIWQSMQDKLYLGDGTHVSLKYNEDGIGTIYIQGISISVKRIPATTQTQAVWVRHQSKGG
jgi:prepilin-type N-terminal cleavage/methylation domain-containing protein